MKKLLLSTELTKCVALALAGQGADQVAQRINSWRFTGKKNNPLSHWVDSITDALRYCAEVGAPIAPLLKGVVSFIRAEEKNISKMTAINQSFAFQCALLLIVPWAASSLVLGINWNFISVAGLVIQVLGIFCFLFFVRKGIFKRNLEQEWLFLFLLNSWIFVLCGLSLEGSLKRAISLGRAGFIKEKWISWLQSLVFQQQFVWKKHLMLSSQVAESLEILYQTGAPAGDVLFALLGQFEEQRQSEVEGKIQGLPTKLALTFCVCFAPATFLIFLGCLWPQIQNIL
ncbi:MAG: hypothetical protein AB7F43_12030 [Bacteriovoracia bacterium]